MTWQPRQGACGDLPRGCVYDSRTMHRTPTRRVCAPYHIIQSGVGHFDADESNLPFRFRVLKLFDNETNEWPHVPLGPPVGRILNPALAALNGS